MSVHPDEPGAAAQTVDPVRLVWAVLTSPVTAMATAAALGVLLALGAFLGQGMTEGELLGERSFATARALRGLGLTDLLTSWVVWFLGLIFTFSTAGLLVRHVWLTSADARSWSGPSVDHATCTTTASLEAVKAALEGRMGRTTQSSGLVVGRAGYFAEGLIVAAIGVLVLLGAVVVERVGGFEARLDVLGGAAPPAKEAAPSLVVRVLEDGDWIARQLPLSARCAETSLTDPARGWRCTLTRTTPSESGPGSTTEEAQITLGPGWPDEAFGLTFHVAKERPLPGHGALVRLVDGDRLVYSGPPGRTATLSDGQQLTAFAGPDGPMAVIKPTTGSPFLLLPSTDPAAPPAQVGGAALSTAPAWRLTLGATRHPGSALIWTGMGLLLLGFAVLAAAPHLTVTARAEDGKTALRAWSFNRLGVAERLLDEVETGGAK